MIANNNIMVTFQLKNLQEINSGFCFYFFISHFGVSLTLKPLNNQSLQFFQI